MSERFIQNSPLLDSQAVLAELDAMRQKAEGDFASGTLTQEQRDTLVSKIQSIRIFDRESRECVDCGQLFEYFARKHWDAERQERYRCRSCAEQLDRTAADRDRRSLNKFFEECPTAAWYFREAGEPPRPVALADVMQFTCDEAEKTGVLDTDGWKDLADQSILAFGASQTGKTTAIFTLLREMVEQGDFEETGLHKPWFTVLSGVRLRQQIADASRKENELTDLIESLCEVPKLFIEDIDKTKWTERTESELADLLQARLESGRQTFITSGLAGEALKRVFYNENIGNAIVERLRAHYRIVNFDAEVQ